MMSARSRKEPMQLPIRKLTKAEIKDILKFIVPNTRIPSMVANEVVAAIKKDMRKQLEEITIHPELIPRLPKTMKIMYMNALAQPGECVGIVMAQSIGEKQTQSNLNAFHRAGSSDKQPVVSKFSELLNATNKPKAPSFLVYFKWGNDTVPELRQTIGHSLVQLSFKRISKSFSIHIDKEDEPWYPAFDALNGDVRAGYTDCISLIIDMEILFEYKLTLQEIAEYISVEYSDLHCIYSPDCFGQLDIFVDTQTIDLPEEKLVFVTPENAREIYLEEVVQPTLENIVLCGIPGIMNMFFVRDSDSSAQIPDQKWIVETENSREKIIESTKFKNTKVKPADSIKRFKKVLAHPAVDMTKTLSNNVWDIYHTLGVEAVRQYMIDEFSKIMEGINVCHVMLLVDKMTNGGTIASISRYTMRREETGVLGKCSFEETLDNLLSAGIYGQQEPTQGVSASIICGKRARIGTGLCDIAIDLQKLMTVPEEDGSCEED
jgi:DNA-directed RNA polymerase beta' subunit